MNFIAVISRVPMTEENDKSKKTGNVIPIGFAETQAPYRLKKDKMSKPFKAALDAVEEMDKKDKN